MRILIVEDDPGISSFIDKGLRAEGYQSEVAATVADARAVLRAPGSTIDLVLLDRGLPDADGASLLAEMRARGDLTRRGGRPGGWAEPRCQRLPREAVRLR